MTKPSNYINILNIINENEKLTLKNNQLTNEINELNKELQFFKDYQSQQLNNYIIEFQNISISINSMTNDIKKHIKKFQLEEIIIHE